MSVTASFMVIAAYGLELAVTSMGFRECAPDKEARRACSLATGNPASAHARTGR